MHIILPQMNDLLFLCNPANHVPVLPQPFMPLVTLNCSPDVHHFLCQAFIPACTEGTNVLRPCREQCEAVLTDCNKLITTFEVTWPPELQCDR